MTTTTVVLVAVLVAAACVTLAVWRWYQPARGRACLIYCARPDRTLAGVVGWQDSRWLALRETRLLDERHPEKPGTPMVGEVLVPVADVHWIQIAPTDKETR